MLRIFVYLTTLLQVQTFKLWSWNVQLTKSNISATEYPLLAVRRAVKFALKDGGKPQ